MFETVIESGRRLVAKLERYVHTPLHEIPPNERMASSETSAWFNAATNLITRAFGENSPELARWHEMQLTLREESYKEIDAGIWNQARSDIRSIHQSMGLLAEFEIYTELSASAGGTPVEIRASLARFRADHPDPAKAVFLMMRFGKTRAHENIVAGIRAALDPMGIAALRADGKEYHGDLFYNVLTYVYGCSFGIAVFERIETEQFNPNVALEVGYLFALQKPVCLLKDKTLATLQADLVGKLYRTFDPLDPVATIPEQLSSWMRDKGLA